MVVLRPRDFAILLKIVISEKWTTNSLAKELFLSPSEIHHGAIRAHECRLYDIKSRQVKVRALKEFIEFGLPYVFPASRGLISRGMPTSIAAPPLVEKHFDEPELPPIWPHPMGLKRGYILEPLYKRIPDAAAADEKFYELLALIDVIREGDLRSKKLAMDEINVRLEAYSRYLLYLKNDTAKDTH